ncbi:MAG: DEAD/DEAH box helicase [Candidatus Micrarchaeota archaeon]
MPFSKLGISPNIMRAVKELGFEKPTGIQESAIPLMLQGEDLIGQAKTGTGKTAAFAIPILQLLQSNNKVQALVLEPTRELALQVAAEFRELGKYSPHSVASIYGGEDIQRQMRELQRGVQIAVCTPGRLLDHLERRTIDLSQVHFVVLDEADRMLDMGFIDDVKRILSHLPPKRQMVFFSATMPDEIANLAQQYMQSPQILKVSADTLTVDEVTQYFTMSDPRHKLQILLHLLATKKPKSSIIFTRTKRGADNLFYSLTRNGLHATLLHGNLTQAKRERSMHAFRHQHADILVATDIAARGIDVENVALVVNYNMPEDAMVYAHRIGRTARAGKLGEALTFVTNIEEKRNIEQFAQALKCTISEMKVEGLQLPTLPAAEEYRGFGKRPEGFARHSGEGGYRGHSRGGPGRGHSGGGREHGGSGRSQGGRGSYGQRSNFRSSNREGSGAPHRQNRNRRP